MSEDNSTTSSVEYREVPGTNGAYRVGTDGSVWCCLTLGYSGKRVAWRPVKSSLRRDTGHLRVNIWDQNTFKTQYVHRLVLEAFVGPCPVGLESRHLNGNPADNRLDNLRWDTRRENNLDRARHGRINPCRGENTPVAKLTLAQVVAARQRRTAGEKISIIAREFNVNHTTLTNAINGKRWAWLTIPPPVS